MPARVLFLVPVFAALFGGMIASSVQPAKTPATPAAGVQEPKTPAQPANAEPENIVKDDVVRSGKRSLLEDLLAAGAPKDGHKLLQDFAGEWTVSSTFIPGLGQAPINSTGNAKAEWIIGGRFLQISSTLESGETKSEAQITLGFDTRHKHYTYHGIDSFGTYAVDASGPFDDATQTFTLSGVIEEPTPMDGDPWRKYDFQMLITRISKDQWKQLIQIKLQNENWITVNSLDFTRVIAPK